MADNLDILRLRVLMSFLKEDETCTVGGIARTLNETKQRISRVIIAMDEDGLIDRSNSRHPVLTQKGMEKDLFYNERINISLDHLIYEGVSIENAKNDAYHWALYNTDETMDIIRKSEERFHIKYELRGQERFNGDVLCQKMEDGDYQLPFIIYREHVQNNSNISMANDGFEHPCVISVRNGVGTVQLKAISISASSGATGKSMRGRIRSLRYFQNNEFIGAENSGNILSFPASALNFVNIGEGAGQILHGTVCLKMLCTVGQVHMPESTAIFTILI